MPMIGSGYARFLGVNTNPDQTSNYNTPLTQGEEAAFQQWRARLPPNLQNMQDYDLRGAWKKNAHSATNGHLPDDWKKPNHPTFSNESIYSGPYTPGGQWQQLPRDKWQFSATDQNLKYRDPEALLNYFRQVEPGNTLQLPNQAPNIFARRP
jgi:hypothetical protein